MKQFRYGIGIRTGIHSWYKYLSIILFLGTKVYKVFPYSVKGFFKIIKFNVKDTNEEGLWLGQKSFSITINYFKHESTTNLK